MKPVLPSECKPGTILYFALDCMVQANTIVCPASVVIKAYDGEKEPELRTVELKSSLQWFDGAPYVYSDLLGKYDEDCPAFATEKEAILWYIAQKRKEAAEDRKLYDRTVTTLLNQEKPE